MGQVQEECQGKPLREVTSDAESRMMRNQPHWMGRDGLHVFRRNTWLQKLLLRIYTPSSSAREEGCPNGGGGSDGKRVCGMSAVWRIRTCRPWEVHGAEQSRLCGVELTLPPQNRSEGKFQPRHKILG